MKIIRVGLISLMMLSLSGCSMIPSIIKGSLTEQPNNGTAVDVGDVGYNDKDYTLGVRDDSTKTTTVSDNQGIINVDREADVGSVVLYKIFDNLSGIGWGVAITLVVIALGRGRWVKREKNPS